MVKSKNSNTKIEIMAPAGSYETLIAAINAGAKSVYFGVGNLNMRSHSANFTYEDLPKIVSICKKNKVKSYLALNIIAYDEDLKEAKVLCDLAKDKGICAIIAADISIIEYAKSIKLEVHMSTQCNISNLDAVKFYSKYADVIVLARELKLEQIKNICDEIKKQKIKGPSGKLIQIEVFIHGALCIAISGKCYMSLAQYNSSANRGACFQACRREYKVTDAETGDELKIDNKYIMSPSDLCTIGMLDKLINAGATILKIEGRGRSPEYVSTVVKNYKEAVDAITEKNSMKYNSDNIKKWRNELDKVYNRGFWEGGYYIGLKTGEWCGTYGGKATKTKFTVGTVTNYFNKPKIAEIFINTQELKINDEIIITGPTTGVVNHKIKEIRKDNKKITIAKKGDTITIPISEKLRKNDAVFVVVNTKTQ